MTPSDMALPSSPAPQRPTTPALRWSFVLVLLILVLAATLVYVVPYAAFRAGYSYESGRSQAAFESLTKLDQAGVITRASELFRQAAAATTPAVVSIQCLRNAGAVREAMKMPEQARPRGATLASFGSGVVIDKRQGFIVTNGHVVEGADEILVRVGGQELIARLIGADSKTDLAVLQVAGPLEAEAEWADIERVDVGDWVLAIGSPFTLEHSVSVGIVSAINRRNLRILGESSSYEDFIQTDAAINPGNSGGPLVDLRGRIVGINTAIYNPRSGVDLAGQGGNVGIGFALSAALAKNVVEQLIKSGRVVRGYMGVILSDLDPLLVKELGLPNGRGALVAEIDPDSPAAQGGLRRADVITALAGQPVSDLADLRNRIAMLSVGTNVELTYYRDGKKGSAQVVIAELPTLRSLGIRMEREARRPSESLPGVAIEQVQMGSPAFRAGLRPGQRILAIGSRSVATRDEAEAVAGRFDVNKGIDLDVLDRNGERHDVKLGGRVQPPRVGE